MYSHPLCSIGCGLLLLCTGAVQAAEPLIDSELPDGARCDTIVYHDVPFDVFWVDPAKLSVDLYWKNDEGTPFTTFEALQQHVEHQGKRLVFASNAGIYARDRTPLGFHLENGKECEPLNRKSGGGNFFMKPNGVFYLDASGAHVLETEDFAEAKATPTLAVQSGPLLLNKGAIHPKFQPDSSNLHIRNGVGVNDKGEIVFALARFPVNLHTFASFFKEAASCASALYLDGAISAFYAPCLDRTQTGGDFVGILAVSTKRTGDHGQD